MVISSSFETGLDHEDSNIGDLMRVFLAHRRLDIRCSQIPRTGYMKHGGDDFSKFFGVSHFVVLNRTATAVRLKMTIKNSLISQAYGQRALHLVLNFSIEGNPAYLDADRLLYVHISPTTRRIDMRAQPVKSLGALAELVDLAFTNGGDAWFLEEILAPFELKTGTEQRAILDCAKAARDTLSGISRALK